MTKLNYIIHYWMLPFSQIQNFSIFGVFPINFYSGY